MEWHLALLLMLGMVVGGMFLGLPVAFAFLGANIIGMLVFMGGAGSLEFLSAEMYESVARYSFLPIILFLLMGEILFQSRVAFRAINAVDLLISKMPGRMSIVSIAGGTIFSSLTGSSIANTALMGGVLLPDMLKRGYAPSIAMGPIMATGGIAMLVPPSALAVLLGSLAYIPIASLLIAGILPGILMAVAFVTYVLVICTIRPDLAPAGEEDSTLTTSQRWKPFLIYVVPLMGIFVAVVGSIFSGIASPTEAAAIGCVAAVIASIAYRSLTWEILKNSLTETAKVAVMILLIIAGSTTFSQILSVSGATQGMLQYIETLEFTAFSAVFMMLIVLIFLGAFMDQVSMMLLTLPFFLPIAAAHGVDMLWLGVLFLVVMEVSLMTPPFGLLLFVMRGVAPKSISMLQIYGAAFPFIMLELAVLFLLFLWPDLALWLPRQFD
ncbi:C4-dicarboxylate ABC transporter permease [Rhodobacterales bacterium 52_120_T64]|nr:C4-dicarboxylate ABC transporter permease [Rhodobacterales bacterium 52_120_T64]